MAASHVVCSAPLMHVALSQSLVTTRLKDSLTLKLSLWLGSENGGGGDQGRKCARISAGTCYAFTGKWFWYHITVLDWGFFRVKSYCVKLIWGIYRLPERFWRSGYLFSDIRFYLQEYLGNLLNSNESNLVLLGNGLVAILSIMLSWKFMKSRLFYSPCTC